ncbi:ankyrin repeat-containing domain protein [Aspergillus pseudonomiae]|uniref:Ankyrin repeat-containing domain protein n=1 Tax=Aspergillus pseudonomiae TaxID=1506151 RepID=A0A5N7DK83_9EURO|nr:ankyrin repeat-containing domain protein [Aspergillus pseudonomiae]KAE8406840.1 ankyrin repeat-containing domain protein [Aspergillus pseudonomiae]
MCQLLLANDANVDQEDKYGRTTLWYAIERGQREIANILIENGARPCLKDGSGVSAFVSAQKHEHTDVWKGLTYYGDIEATYSVNNTTLRRAVDKDDKYAVNILLHCGANPNAKDRKGKTPLHLVVEGGYGSVIRILIESGADCHSKGILRRTPLKQASAAGDTMLATVLSDRNCKTTSGLL